MSLNFSSFKNSKTFKEPNYLVNKTPNKITKKTTPKPMTKTTNKATNKIINKTISKTTNKTIAAGSLRKLVHSWALSSSSTSSSCRSKSVSSSRLLGTPTRHENEKSATGLEDAGPSFTPTSSKPSAPRWSPKLIKTTIEPSPYVKHTIELLQHKRDIQTRLENLESSGIVQNIGSMPTITTSNPSKGEYLLENIPMQYCEVKNVIMKRLAIHLSHVGFTHSRLQPFEVLGDAVNDFYVKMTSRLKQIRERELAGVDHGFPDPMERVLVEMGMGGVRGLEKFYKSKVLNYQERMVEQCNGLRTHYAHTIHKGFRRPTTATATSSTSLSPQSSIILPANSSGPKDMQSSLIRLLRSSEPANRISIPDVDVKPQINNETLLMESNLLRLNFEGTALSTNT